MYQARVDLETKGEPEPFDRTCMACIWPCAPPDFIPFLYFPTFSTVSTACVTRWWVGRENATLMESTSSQEYCPKTRRLPPVGCTLCWTVFGLPLTLLRFRL